MKSYIGLVKVFENVPDEKCSGYNSDRNIVSAKYELIEENKTPDRENVEVSFVMWAAGMSYDKIKSVLEVLNK